MTRITVVGGGIGGLAAALALARDGHRVTVVERSPEFAELGAGIQIAPNGILALERIGLGDATRRIGVGIAELRLMDGLSGEHVTSLPLTDVYRQRFDNPYVVVHRGELFGLLLSACQKSPLVTLRAGAPAVGYAQDEGSATVLLVGGERITADLVIGADGIHSAIRQQLAGDGPPRVSGITVYRTIVPMELVPQELRWNAVTWWVGPGRHFVHYPIAGGRFLNLAPSHENGATDVISGVPVPTERVLDTFAGFGPVARHLLELGDEWRSWVLVDRDPIDTWTDGRVALLGDAAHPMLHYAAQGACQALEDAVVLADELSGGGDPVDALRRYADARRPRTAAISRIARQSIDLWHPAGDAAVARNKALGAMSVRELHDSVAWMHGARDFTSAAAPAISSTPVSLPRPLALPLSA